MRRQVGMKTYGKALIFLSFLACAIPAHAADLNRGKAIFKRLCSHCHLAGYDEKFAPGLAGVTDRRDTAWLHRFLQNPGQMIRQDEDAKALKESNTYNLTMPTLPEMQDEQNREDVIAYLSTLQEE